MKFLDYIFYRYYSYLFNKNSVGDDLLKAQFFITFFFYLNLIAVTLIINLFFPLKEMINKVFYFITALLLFIFFKKYYNKKKIDQLDMRYKNQSDTEYLVAGYIMTAYCILSFLSVVLLSKMK
jgi:hypothetical protein